MQQRERDESFPICLLIEVYISMLVRKSCEDGYPWGVQYLGDRNGSAKGFEDGFGSHSKLASGSIDPSV